MAINASSGGQLQGGSSGSGGSGLTEEDVQDIVAEQIEVGNDINIGLQTSYDDVTGKLKISLSGAGGGLGGGGSSSGISVQENATGRGTATTLNFVGPNVSVQNNIATITGGLDSISVYENASNRGNLTSINFVSGATVNVVDGTANIVIDPSTGFVTASELTDAIFAATAPLASKSYVTSQIAALPQVDLTDYALKSYVVTQIASQIDDIPPVDLTSYASKSYVAAEIAGIPPVNLSNYATTSYVLSQINSVLDGAPSALNTLKEIATALGNNATFADTIAASVATKASQSYVDAQLATKVTQYELTAATSSTASTLTNYINSAIAGIPAYSLPTASSSTLGGVKVGSGLTVNNDGTLSVNLSWDSITGKPSLFSGSYADLTGKPTFATVATSGSYADLTNKPSLFSGSYTDLTNKPTIPSLDGYATEAYVDEKLSSLNLEDLTDTYVTGVTDGQALVWSQSNLRWQPGTVGSGGSGNYTLPTASGSTLGGIKLGSGLSIDGNGVVSVTGGGSNYTLPVASTLTLGGVKVDGTTITINGNGVISAVGGSSGGVTLSDVGTYLNNNGYATQTYVQGQVDNLVNGATSALNTLNELATALGNDASFATTITSGLAGKVNLSGGTMTGALTLSGAPTSPLHAATKAYVDTQISSGLSNVGSGASSVSQLTDVDLTGIAAGKILAYDGSMWVPVNNSGAKGDTGATGAQGPQGLSISAATVTLAGRLQLTLTDNSVVDAGNVSGIKAAVVNSSGELVLTKQDNSTINVGSVVGPQGATGAQGIQGIQGDTGLQGPAGTSIASASVNNLGRLLIVKTDNSTVDAGYVLGPQGQQGIQGETGATGAQGPAGATGPKGDTGDAGVKGDTGSVGPKGDQGIGVYSAVVDGDGYLQVTLDDANTLNAGYVRGIQGVQGPSGAPGRSIADAGVQVDASGYLQVTLTDGVTVNAGYVVGPQGSTGATGAVGPKGDTGETGPQGPQGTSYTVNSKSGSVQVYGLGNTTQPGFDLEVDLANKATKLSQARTISLTGKVTGLVSTDFSGNVSITTALNSVTSTDISEGTNKYFTEARAQAAITSTADGSISSLISYDQGTGVIKYRASTSYITEGSNLYFTNTRADARADVRIGASSINALADVDTVSSAPQNNQVLTWTGTAWTPANPQGAAGTVSSVNTKTGAVVLSSDDITEGTSNLYFTNSRWDTRLSAKTTDNLSEGTSNKYFSNTLARSALAAGTGLSYNSSTGTFSLNANTDQVSEGTSNLFYTNSRFDTRLGQSNLSALADVTGTTPTTGQALAWNGSAWTPTTISSGGGGGGGSSGVFRAGVQVEYDASGALTGISVLSGGISAVITTATSTVATVTFTFTGSACAPLGIQVYGYQRASNVYVTRAVSSDYTTRTVAGGGTSGAPSAFSAFDPAVNTLTLSLTKALTGATAAVGQTTHCVVQFLLSNV